MRDMAVSDDRVGLLNRSVAASVAVFCTIAMLIWGVPGLDPAMWREVAVVSGLRPPQTVFPGFWRFLAGWLFPLFGTDCALVVLNLIGALAGGLCVYMVALIVRQILSFVIRVERPYREWHRFIAPFFSGLSALAFGLSDPFWRIARTFSPEEIRLLLFLSIVHVSIRWFVAGGHWRLFPAMALMGVMAAETPFAFLLPLVFIAFYVSVWHCVMDGLFPKPEKLAEPDELPKWRMFFLFLGGLVVAVVLNARSFAAFGGLEANGWEPVDVYLRYVIGYWHVFADAASLTGWMLGICFAVMPFVVAVRIAPLVIRDDRRMPFNLGMLMFFIGVLAMMQTGAFPSARFWTFVKGSTLVGSGFLLVFFVFCDMVALAIFGASFTFECQRDRSGNLQRGILPALAVVLMALILVRLPKPLETEMQRIIDDAIAETVTECGDARWIFTDGHLDAALELESFRRGGKLRAFNMMSGSDPWEINLRRRYFEPDSEDFRSAETGVPILLRVWAGEKKNGMDGVALQLGFEFWRRDNKPLPKISGLVARATGMDDAAAQAGIARAKELSKRILAIAPKVERADPDPVLVSVFSAVNWRLSRFARLREDVELADNLDDMNGTLKRMLNLVEQERLRTFMQMTPAEGLQIALRRADFMEAKRYATVVLNHDDENPEANFAMGMGAIREKRYEQAEHYLRMCLKKRPNEPAVLNNLSIICRKQGKYKDAEDFARRAQKLAPNIPEIKKTLKDALKKAP